MPPTCARASVENAICSGQGRLLSPQRCSQSQAADKAAWQISQDKLYNCRYVDAGFIRHTPLVEGGLFGHVPDRPECTTPHIRVLGAYPERVALYLWIGLPRGSTSP